MADQRVNVKVTTQGAGKAKTELKGVEGAISKMGKAVGIASAAYFGARGIISGFSAVIELAGEQEKAEKKLEVALGKRSQALLDQASALQQVTTFGDEAIIGVQASIGAFVDSEDQIKKATEATLDMAVAMGMDLKGAGDLIAKTLGSSTNALARYGIEVTGAVGSTERLESLTENVARLFGGQAKAQAETMAGAIEQMHNAVGDAGEEMGKVLAPVVIATAKGMKTLAEGVGNVIERFKDFGKEIDAVLLDKTALAKQEIDAFRDSVKGLSETELLDLGSEIERSGEKMGRWTDETTLNNEKLKILEDTILALRERQENLGQAIETTTELRKTETGVVFELDAEYQKFIETQKVNFANQVAEAGMVARLIQDYPELAKALGLVNDKAKQGNNIWENFSDNLEQAGANAIFAASSITSTEDALFTAEIAAKKAAIAFITAEIQKAIAAYIASTIISAGPAAPLVAAGAIAAGAAMGSLMGSAIERMEFAALGADQIVNKPTLFMTGERGAERVQVTPLQGPNINGPQGLTINFNGPITDQGYVRDFILPEIERTVGGGLA